MARTMLTEDGSHTVSAALVERLADRLWRLPTPMRGRRVQKARQRVDGGGRRARDVALLIAVRMA